MASSSSSASHWACSRCTFLNSSRKSTCEVCLFPPPSPSFSSSSSSSLSLRSTPFPPPSSSPAASAPAPAFFDHWSCRACTFSNHSGVASCEVCGATRDRGADNSFSYSARTRSTSFLDLEPEPEELAHPAIGSVFLPLRRCGSKRPYPNTFVLDDGDGDGVVTKVPAEKVARIEDDDDGVMQVTAEKLARIGNAKVEAPVMVVGDVDIMSFRGMLKILSYNVWFHEDLEVYRRMEALGNLIQKYSPDIICFQEVTPNIYRIFNESSWWKEYKCSVLKQESALRPYFCMQMSRLPVNQFCCKQFSNSIMGRELCLADIDLGGGKKVIVATSHLESPCPAPPRWDQMYSKERVAQAKEAINLLKDSPNAIFGGDMNWNEKLDGDFPLSDGWFDAWLELRPGENGWTYDTKANKMLSANRTLQKRLDRFLCKLRDFRIDGIEMVGLEAIPDLSYTKEKMVKKQLQKLVLPVLPSDHYGLLLTISSL